MSEAAPVSSLATARHLAAEFDKPPLMSRVSNWGEESSIAVEGAKQSVAIRYADENLTRVFDLPFLAGDPNTSLSKPQSAVISGTLADSLFGTREVMGRALLINGKYTAYVTGVIDALPQPSHMSTESSSAPLYFQALVSMDVHEATIRDAESPEVAALRIERPIGFMWYYTYVVLPAGGQIGVADLEQRLKAIIGRFTPAGTPPYVKLSLRHVSQISLTGLDRTVSAERTGLSATSLLFLLGSLVLVVSALNYANLATAQAATRLKETAMRRVVGAHRLHVVAQYLFEALLLTGCALLMALVMVVLLRPLLSGEFRSALDMLLYGSDSARFWLIALGIVTAAGFLAGAYPAFGMARVRPAQALKSARAKIGSRLLSSMLVGGQFAAASFLIITVLVMSRQNDLLQQASFNLSEDPVVAIGNSTRVSAVDMKRLRAELSRHSQVKAVSAAMFPMGFAANDQGTVSDTVDASTRRLIISQQLIDHDFFATIGLKTLAGRTFDRSFGDDVSDASLPRAGNIIVDEVLVRRMGWGSPHDALGKMLYVPGLANGRANSLAPSLVVGVVEERALFAMSGAPDGTVYQLVPHLAAFPLIRISRDDIRGGVAAVEEAWNRIAPNVALQQTFLDENFDRSLQVFRLVSNVFRYMTAGAIFIATIGLIGMATHMVRRRIHEIGVRKTMGASVTQILTMLLRDFSKPILIANVVVWPLAFIAARAYVNMFVQRSPLTPTPFIVTLIVTLLIAWVAVSLHAVRAARVKPSTVLRYE
jgi:putative ABC transport system permease protein